MSKIKKVLAMLLALAMVLGTTLTAFAATKSEAEIHVSNAENATLTYVQVIQPNQTTVTGWEFSSQDIANAYTSAFGVSDAQDAIKAMLNQTDGRTEQISKALSNVVENKNIVFKSMENPQKVTSAGVYAIHATEEGFTYNNMSAYVGFYDGEGTLDYPSLKDAELEAKKAPTTVIKDNNDPDDVKAIGDTVDYTVKAYVPYINPNDENKTFFVYDNIEGATYNLEGAQITVGGKTITNEIILNDDKTGFSIDLSDLIDATNSRAGDEIVVTYKAVITNEVVENKVEAGHKGGSEFGSDISKIFTGTITLVKYGENEEVKLSGAGFKVTKDSDTTVLKFTKESEGIYKFDKAGTEEEVFVNDQGELVVKGLDVGSYHFTETTAPKGYSINTVPSTATLVVDENNKDAVATTIIRANTSMSDTKLSSLPSTGGIGTTIFTIGGCLIMIAAAGLFFASRRKSAK